ncbi:MAG TPA: 1-(5-phosphoribosyl)-5-[(5-phosphoribosylamino)methylideneamino] imidazole-4-carboxamide isomerase [Gaiellales bacterium]|jgi:phosphoribosylformimino-5-aminoimidazole carboxamide ribotide isomerase|nr:1-(5-phosphoribosyl)-5-[(5-phosphoribosylamino)methylideneamino] imidazole-4-carboxamide isomerase [Gaiellales bacterium]
MALEVIPAVDLSGGRVVRLLQGDYGRVTGFDETPDEAADRFALAGAGWLHVIDLDAARDGERSPEHAAVLARLARRRGTRVQVGGGFRSAGQVEDALASGVQRVLIGTLAARDPDAVAALAAEHGPRICVCADALEGTVRIAGWREDAGESPSAFVERFTARGVGAFLVTAIERDGTLAGPDLQLLAAVRAVTDAVLLAAGGFAALEHIAAARDVGCDGAVVGRALYDGSLNLREALTLARQQA